jgi:hypothetical protein
VLPGGSPDTFVIAHPAIAYELRAQLERDGDMATYRGLFEAWGVKVLGGLRAGELAPGETPAYLVRHLAQHLTAGADLHPAALQLATPYWRRVKDAVSDETTGFQTDLETVMARARRLDAAQVERGEPPRRLPERVMCAAEVAGNRQALATSMTPELAAEFVRAGLWRPQRALSYVDQYTYPGLTDRVDAVVAIAPVVPADQLPELNRLVRAALETIDSEEQAAVVGAWARRLFELGRVGEALDAFRLTGMDPEHRGFVEVWVLADLIPHFEDDRAAEALARAIDVLRETYRDLSYAACRLTRNLAAHRAEELWRAREQTRPGEALVVELCGRRQQSVTRPDLTQDAMHFAVQSHGFVAAARWLTDEECSAFIARGLELALGTPGQSESAREVPSESDMSEFRSALLPGINYDGLLSVLPAADAAVACDWLRRVVSGHKLLGCLAQLLPLLDAVAAEPSPTSCSRRPPRSSGAWIVTEPSCDGLCRPSWPRDWPTGWSTESAQTPTCCGCPSRSRLTSLRVRPISCSRRYRHGPGNTVRGTRCWRDGPPSGDGIRSRRSTRRMRRAPAT